MATFDPATNTTTCPCGASAPGDITGDPLACLALACACPPLATAEVQLTSRFLTDSRRRLVQLWGAHVQVVGGISHVGTRMSMALVQVASGERLMWPWEDLAIGELAPAA